MATRVHVAATRAESQVPAAALALGEELAGRGLRVLVDDRAGVSAGVKFTDAELLGMPTIVVVGRGLAAGRVELRDRRSGKVSEVPLTEVVDSLTPTGPTG